MADSHPLDQLSGSEILAAADAVRIYLKARNGSPPRFNNITLLEPSRQELLLLKNRGLKPARRAHVIVTEQYKRNPIELNVEFRGSYTRVISMRVCNGITSMIADDQEAVESAMKRDPELIRLVQQYGLSMDNVTIDSWIIQATPGEIPTEEKWLQGFLYWSPVPGGNFYSHPLPFMPILDDATKKVIRIENAHKTLPPLNEVASEYLRTFVTEPYRTDLKPLLVSQPEGPSFTVEGNLVKWQKWEMRVGFNYREGLVLHGIGYNDSGRLRPILHRMSIAEMAVPYGDPQAPFNKKLAFDAGDVGLGLTANSLRLGCDCLGVIKYFDGIVSNSKGEPVIIKNAICLHEEDDGISWKHTDYHTGSVENRRGRRLVVSFLATLANYEYVFNFIFRTDASIQCEVKLTGQISTHMGSPEDLAGDPQFGTMILPGVVAPYHQHLFCARLDFVLDDASGGENLVVSEVDVEVLRGARNRYGNAFVKKETDLTSELKAQRLADGTKARYWKVKNTAVKNKMSGQPVAYKIVHPSSQPLLGLPGSATLTRAGFASKHLWATPYSPSEQWPGGKYPLQNPHPGGLLEWTKQDRPLKSPTVWCVFGATHIPRAEDFPVMPVETVSIHLKPFGFFAANPANDLPPTEDKSSLLYSPKPTTVKQGHTHWVSRL